MLVKRTTKLMKAAAQEKPERAKLREVRKAYRAQRRVGLHQPHHTDIEYERALRRVATRGVVALFNAIAQHQHAVQGAADGSGAEGGGATARDVKELSKDNFIQMLKSGAAAAGNKGVAKATAETKGKNPLSGGGAAGQKEGGEVAPPKTATASAWLRDDFMTGRGRSIKDWERHEEQGGSDDDEDDDGGGWGYGGEAGGEAGAVTKKPTRKAGGVKSKKKAKGKAR